MFMLLCKCSAELASNLLTGCSRAEHHLRDSSFDTRDLPIGFERLCSVDTRFEPFQSTLFSQAGLEINRDQRTKTDNEALDASLNAFIRLLTDHFLSVAAFQALEYLIRRYR